MSKENTNNKNMESTTRPKNAVFIMREKGQSWEDFKKACVGQFEKAGMFQKHPPDAGQLALHKIAEKGLQEALAAKASTIPPKKEII
jgi:hypothetical protein